MTEYYRADHLGSLLRPAELLEARSSYDAGTASLESLREVEGKAINQALQLQKEAGIDVFTDGEYRRGSFLVLQRRVREECLPVPDRRRGASRVSAWLVRCALGCPPAIAAVHGVRTVPGAASLAPPGTLGAG